MLLNALVAALAFSAPPSLTRRDLVAGMGAAAAAMVPLSPAFADVSKYAGSADKRAAEKAAAKAVAGPSPYEKIMAASKDAAPPKLTGDFDPNGKLDGVSFRKATDPNACSEVRTPDLRVLYSNRSKSGRLESPLGQACKKKRLERLGYGA